MKLEKSFTPVPGEYSAERAIASALNRSWPVLDAAASAEMARAMIAAGNTEGLLRILPWQEFIEAMGDMRPPLDLMAGRALSASIGDFAPLSAGLSFTNTDAVSIRYAERQAGKLIGSVTEAQREAIRQVMAQAMAGRVTVTQAAAMVRNSIGLHPAWARAVNTYRDRQLTRLIMEGQTAAKATVTADRLGLRYRDRLIRTRSLTIARTEIQTASNLGRFAGWAQMIGNGVASVSSTKEWAPGPGACGICQRLSGETVQWDRPFSIGVMMPPAHPNCRCTAVMNPVGRNVPRQSWLRPEIDAANGLDLSILDDISSPEL